MTPERFAQGMTFDQYVTYAGSPENLARQAGWWLGTTRRDFSGLLRDWHARARLTAAQADAIRWLAARPGGPARMLVISEEWSSDCRRDVPMLARLAEAGGLDMRIFTRDGQTCSRAPRADAADSPNADLVNEFLREQGGRTYQSVPVAAFFTRDFQRLYHYIEFPAIYHKERIFRAMQAKDPSDAGDKRGEAFMREWLSLQEGPFFPMWASAAIDEILSALHERMVVGSPG